MCLIMPSSSFDLREGARVAVEQEPGVGVGFVDAVAPVLSGDLVGGVLAGIHVALGLDAEPVPLVTVARKMSPVEIAGIGEVRGDELDLVPCPRRAGP